MATSSPSSNRGTVFKKKVSQAICIIEAFQNATQCSNEDCHQASTILCMDQAMLQ